MSIDNTVALAAETYSYSVIINAPDCAFTTSTSPVSYAYSTTVLIAPFTLTSPHTDCDITSITCSQTTLVSHDMCSYGSFNSGTLLWEFSSLDPNTLAVATLTYPPIFDLDLIVSNKFG